MSSRENGKIGEAIVEGLLVYEGWEIIDRQTLVHGHKMDLRAKHPKYGEAIFEVKVWGAGGGQDTAKKAIADAYDLQRAGETTPYILVLSHQLSGLLRNMLVRALEAGAIHQVRVIGFLPFEMPYVIAPALVRSPKMLFGEPARPSEFDGSGEP